MRAAGSILALQLMKRAEHWNSGDDESEQHSEVAAESLATGQLGAEAPVDHAQGNLADWLHDSGMWHQRLERRRSAQWLLILPVPLSIVGGRDRRGRRQVRGAGARWLD